MDRLSEEGTRVPKGDVDKRSLSSDHELQASKLAQEEGMAN
jgi:hypothetical protein